MSKMTGVVQLTSVKSLVIFVGMNINTNAARFLIAPPLTFFQILDLDSRNVMIHQQFKGKQVPDNHL